MHKWNKTNVTNDRHYSQEDDESAKKTRCKFVTEAKAAQ